jgi:tetratricopeptide (TPR) repeat protein
MLCVVLILYLCTSFITATTAHSEEDEELDALLEEATVLLENELYLDVIQFCTGILEEYPDSQEAMDIRSEAQAFFDDLDAGLKYIDEVLDEEPGNDFAWYMRGHVHYNMGEYSLAIEDFTSAIEINDERADYFLLRGVTWLLLDQDDRAQADVFRALMLDPAILDGLGESEEDEDDKE